MRIIFFILFCLCCAVAFAEPVTLQQPKKQPAPKEKVVIMQPATPETYEPSPETRAKMITLSNGQEVPYGQGVIKNADGTCDCELPATENTPTIKSRRWLIPVVGISTGALITGLMLRGGGSEIVAPPSSNPAPTPTPTTPPAPPDNPAPVPEASTLAQLFLPVLLFSLYKFKKRNYI